MLNQFQNNIKQYNLFTKNNKLLLAVSGGKDSVLLAHFLKESGYNFTLAHCNFNLRGSESDDDEKFCIALAKTLGVKIVTKKFDTLTHSKKNKLSIQMAARELRYTWFNELMNKKKIDYLLTAHHATDNVETVLINLLRGTGLKGLTGIALKNEDKKIVRPLLFFTSDEITKYVTNKKFAFREDSSNSEDKYKRNFIRLNILPQLKKIQPSLESVMLENSRVLFSEYLKLEDLKAKTENDVLKKTKLGYTINIDELVKIKQPENTLYNSLYALHFSKTQIKNISNCLKNNAPSGKLFLSKTHNLIIDRKEIKITKKTDDETFNKAYTSITDLKTDNNILVKKLEKFITPKSNELIINADKLIFPLTIRTIKTGDKFKPFGMKGFKLVSDFLREQKINLLQKNKIKILVNGNNEIIWIINLRSDERYRVNSDEKKIILIKIE